MTSGPILLCYDASDEAAAAIGAAAERLCSREAVVVTVRESISKWEPDDRRAVRSGGGAKLDSLDPDEVAAELALDVLGKGVALARAVGFDARGHLAGGKTWRAIRDVADEVDASTIVLGARGLSRVQSVLLGSVSSAVALHARRPVLIIPAQEAGSEPTRGGSESRSASADREPSSAELDPES